MPPPASVPSNDRPKRSAELHDDAPPDRAAPRAEPRTFPTPNPFATVWRLQTLSENTPPQPCGSDSTMPPNPPMAPPTIDESVRSRAWPARTRGALATANDKQPSARKTEHGIMSPKKGRFDTR